jgi:hypothetical protein
MKLLSYRPDNRICPHLYSIGSPQKFAPIALENPSFSQNQSSQNRHPRPRAFLNALSNRPLTRPPINKPELWVNLVRELRIVCLEL